MLKRISKQLVALALFFAALLVALNILAHILYPERKYIDSKLVRETVYSKEAIYVLFGRNALMRNSKKIIFLGASDVRYGFRPGDFQKYAREYEIHNMSVGGSNINQIRQVVKLIQEAAPRESLRGSIFVIGIIPDSFLDYYHTRRVRGGSMPAIEEQQKKWKGFYTMRGGEMTPIYPPIALYYLDEILYPYILMNKIYNRIIEIAAGANRRITRPVLLMHVPPVDNDELLNSAFADENIKKRDIDYWNNTLKDNNNMFLEEQFLIMVDMAKMATKTGTKVVFVDLPIAKWIKEGNPCFPNYQTQKLKYIKELTSIPNVYYVNMQDMDDESHFYDYAHPKPRYSYLWSDRLAKEIAPILH